MKIKQLQKFCKLETKHYIRDTSLRNFLRTAPCMNETSSSKSLEELAQWKASVLIKKKVLHDIFARLDIEPTAGVHLAGAGEGEDQKPRAEQPVGEIASGAGAHWYQPTKTSHGWTVSRWKVRFGWMWTKFIQDRKWFLLDTKLHESLTICLSRLVYVYFSITFARQTVYSFLIRKYVWKHYVWDRIKYVVIRFLCVD